MRRPRKHLPGFSPHEKLRTLLALSLEDLAMFYGISTSAMGMAEKGKRFLPYRAFSLESALTAALSVAQELFESAEAESLASPPAFTDTWKDRQLRLMGEISKLKKVILRKRYLMQTALRLKLVCAHLRPQFPEENTMQHHKISEWEAIVKYRLGDNEPAEIRFLEKQLAHKQDELAEVNRILGL